MECIVFALNVTLSHCTCLCIIVIRPLKEHNNNFIFDTIKYKYIHKRQI